VKEGSLTKVFLKRSRSLRPSPGGEAGLEKGRGMTAANLSTQATFARAGTHLEASCASAKSNAKKGSRLTNVDFVTIFALLAKGRVGATPPSYTLEMMTMPHHQLVYRWFQPYPFRFSLGCYSMTERIHDFAWCGPCAVIELLLAEIARVPVGKRGERSKRSVLEYR